MKFLGVETGVGWVPHLLEMMDDRYWRNRHWTGIQLKHPPSEYWRRNWAGTFIIDRSGIALREMVGIENMMWSTDFPIMATIGLIPAKPWRNFSPESARKKQEIVAANCARLYQLDS